MAKKSGLVQSLFVEGFDLSGDVGAINSANVDVAQLEQTGIDKSAMERVRARRDASLDFLSYFNDEATIGNHPVLSGLLGNRNQKIVTWALGRTLGDPALAFLSRAVSPYNRNAAEDGAFTGTTQAVADGTTLEDMVMLTAHTDTHASADTNASVDAGASSSSGASAVVHVISIASGTPAFVVQDSANDSTFATLISLGAVAEDAAARGTSTGTVDRYVRAQTTGTFTNAVFAMAYRRGTADDYAA